MSSLREELRSVQEAAAGNSVHLRADLQAAQSEVATLTVRVRELEAQRRVAEKQLKVCWRIGGWGGEGG